MVFLDADGEPVHIWGLPQMQGCSFCSAALEASGVTQKLHLQRPCGLCSICMHCTDTFILECRGHSARFSASQRGKLIVIVHVSMVTDLVERLR